MKPKFRIRFDFGLVSDLILVPNLVSGSDCILVSNLFWKKDSQFNCTLVSEMKRPSLSSTPNAAHSKPNGFS